ncbi:MAG: protein kinase [Myxococcales bacterium]|nr:protein kinase [Myxococcales bacterium]
MSTTQRRALVVGVQAYLDAGLAPRPGTCAALRAVAERLRAGGYHVALLVDDAAHDAERPLLANLLDRLGWLADGADAPLLVLSGHLEDGAFLPRDARRSLLGRTALSLDELVGLLPATTGVVIDGPTPAAPFAGLAWALGAGAAPPVTHGTRGPTRFLRAVQRALAGQATPGVALTAGALFDFVSREADTAGSPPPWHHGPPDRVVLDSTAGDARVCPSCAAEIADAAATFCPSCGTPQHAEQLLDDGRYRLLRTLGEGGMGQVFLAEDTRLKVRRALKVLSLPPGLPAEEQRSLQQRMLQEARAAQKLSDYSHHVVRVFDVGHARERDEPFLVMELLEGETLTQRLARGKLPLTDALALGRTIAETLAVAHAHAMIHRDLKPDNVMLVKRGDDPAFVKLLDFGLVKMEQAEVKTQSGRMMGTLQYMPPEQLRGMQVDARADVFSLGAVLYEMLSGQRANPGRTQQEIFGVLLDRGVKPLAELCPHLPPRLTALVDQCLRLIREQRPPHAGAVAEALASIRPSELAYEPTIVPSDAPPAVVGPTPSVGSGSLAHGEVSSAPALPPSPGRRLALPAAALALGGLAWALWPAPRRPPRRTRPWPSPGRSSRTPPSPSARAGRGP